MFAQHMEDLFGEMPTDVLCHLDGEDDIKSFLAVWVFHSHDTLSEEAARARQYYIEDPDLSPLDPGWPNLAVSRNIMFELYQKEGCFRWKAGMVDFYIDDPVVVRENIQELSKWLRMGEGDLIPYRGVGMHPFREAVVRKIRGVSGASEKCKDLLLEVGDYLVGHESGKLSLESCG